LPNKEEISLLWQRKEKIKRILERGYKINISVSSVGRILTQYRSVLPKVKMQNKRIKTLKKKRIRIAQVKKDMKGCECIYSRIIFIGNY